MAKKNDEKSEPIGVILRHYDGIISTGAPAYGPCTLAEAERWMEKIGVCKEDDSRHIWKQCIRHGFCLDPNDKITYQFVILGNLSALWNEIDFARA